MATTTLPRSKRVRRGKDMDPDQLLAEMEPLQLPQDNGKRGLPRQTLLSSVNPTRGYEPLPTGQRVGLPPLTPTPQGAPRGSAGGATREFGESGEPEAPLPTPTKGPAAAGATSVTIEATGTPVGQEGPVQPTEYVKVRDPKTGIEETIDKRHLASYLAGGWVEVPVEPEDRSGFETGTQGGAGPGPPAATATTKPFNYYLPPLNDKEARAYINAPVPEGDPEGFLISIAGERAKDGSWSVQPGYWNPLKGRQATEEEIQEHKKQVREWAAYTKNTEEAQDIIAEGNAQVSPDQKAQNEAAERMNDADNDTLRKIQELQDAAAKSKRELDESIARGQLGEAIQARKQQAALQILLTISQNPAILFMLGQSGMLEELAKNTGIDFSGWMNTMTAAIPEQFREQLPNAQERARMSPQQYQMILAYHASRTGRMPSEIDRSVTQGAPGGAGGTSIRVW